MSLQDHVPSLELCQEWKKVGGRQDTEFAWVEIGKGIWNIFLRSHIHMGYFVSPPEVTIAAPIASELMEWHKTEINVSYFSPRKLEWVVEAYCGMPIRDKSFLAALMQMVIALKKEEK